MTDRELLELILKNQTDTNTRLEKVDTRLDKMDTRLDKMDSRFDNVENSLSEIKKKIDITHDQVFRNTEAIPEINIKVDRIADMSIFLSSRNTKISKIYLS